MKFVYFLDLDSMVQARMFILSQSQDSGMARWQAPITYCVLIALFFQSNYREGDYLQYTLYGVLLLVGLVGAIWGVPMIQRNHFKRKIQTELKESINGRIELDFQPETIEDMSMVGHFRFYRSSLRQIVELADLYLIYLVGGFVQIIPKNQIKDIDQASAFLKDYASSAGVKYNAHLNWKYR